MTGGNVFDGSLSALAPFGRLVTYGMAGPAGDPKPVPPGALMQHQPRRHRLLAGALHGPARR